MFASRRKEIYLQKATACKCSLLQRQKEVIPAVNNNARLELLSRQTGPSRVGKRRASKERAICAVTLAGYWLLINYERRHQDSSSAEKTAFNSSTLLE